MFTRLIVKKLRAESGVTETQQGFASVQHPMLELDTPRARCPSQLGCRCGRADEYDSQAGEDAALVQEEAAQDELVRELWKGPPDHVVDLPKLPEPEAVRELERDVTNLDRPNIAHYAIDLVAQRLMLSQWTSSGMTRRTS